MVNYYWPILPTFNIFFVTDVKLAHFLMNLSPEVQQKAGFSFEIFGGDPNGFVHGLVFDEGASWSLNRKRIGKAWNYAGVLGERSGVSNL